MKVYARQHGHPHQKVPLHLSPLAGHKILNQAGPVTPHADSECPNIATSTSVSPRFAHDFSRMPVHSKAPVPLQAKLKVNAPGDTYEQEADRVSDEVTSMPDPQLLQRNCACGGGGPDCRNEQAAPEHVQRKRIQGSGLEEIETEPIVRKVPRASGSPLDRATQGFMESRFGHDFSRVRVHVDVQAAESARAVNALAFTFGKDMVFGARRYAPGTAAGRRLLAHELTHVVQQGAADGVDPVHAGRAPMRHVGDVEQVQRQTPKEAESADPLCVAYAYLAKKTIIEGQVAALKASADVEKRLDLIRELKWIWRCGTETEKSEIKTTLETGLGAKPAAAIWKEAGTPFGGYRGVYPGYYSGRGRLKGLGTSEIESFDAFAYDLPGHEDPAKFMSGREATAATEAPVVAATDLLYFYGHQYAQYKNPGLFANFTQTQFIDLRALAGKGDFSRVKLIVSTSCATCCKEAVETFAPLFPNAVVLGFRRSAPLEGETVRNAFDSGIKGLKRPLLLNEPVDVNAIIGVWKSVAKSHYPKEDISQPAYYQGGTVYYLEMGIWKSMPATGAANSCKKKGAGIEDAVH